MKSLLAILLILALTSICSAMTLDEVVKLTKLKTADHIIISLLKKDPLKSPVTTKEVLYLKQNQVSDAVINYLLQLGERKDQMIPKQEGESIQVSENLRTYYTTNKKGKRIRVVTNLDEKGRRMGKPVPPEENRPAKTYEAVEQPPREIIVTVRQEQPFQPEPEDYPEPQPNGIPLDYAYGSSYYPYTPFFQPPVFSPNVPCCPQVMPINRFHVRPPVRRIPVVVRPVQTRQAVPRSAGVIRMHR